MICLFFNLYRNLYLVFKDNEDFIDKNMEQDDEIQATQEDINILDPFTKKEMINPVRHVPCGHVYEKTTILQLIKERKRKGIR